MPPTRKMTSLLMKRLVRHAHGRNMQEWIWTTLARKKRTMMTLRPHALYVLSGARGGVTMAETNRSSRSAKVSSSTMRRTRNPRHGNGAGGSAAVLSARRRRLLWTRRIST